MPLTLILTRHAKSAWDDPKQDDFDRPLNARGRKSASVVGRWLAQTGHVPDLALVSGARRTTETWDRIAKFLPETVERQSVPALYLAEPNVILGALRNQTAPTVMLIGHNPGFAWLAKALALEAPDHPKFFQYPTTATSIFEFQTENWSDVSAGSGYVVDFVVPRDLME